MVRGEMPPLYGSMGHYAIVNTDALILVDGFNS